MAAGLLWGVPSGAAGLVVQEAKALCPGGAAGEGLRVGDVSFQDGPPAESEGRLKQEGRQPRAGRRPSLRPAFPPWLRLLPATHTQLFTKCSVNPTNGWERPPGSQRGLPPTKEKLVLLEPPQRGRGGPYLEPGSRLSLAQLTGHTWLWPLNAGLWSQSPRTASLLLFEPHPAL